MLGWQGPRRTPLVASSPRRPGDRGSLLSKHHLQPGWARSSAEETPRPPMKKHNLEIIFQIVWNDHTWKLPKANRQLTRLPKTGFPGLFRDFSAVTGVSVKVHMEAHFVSTADVVASIHLPPSTSSSIPLPKPRSAACARALSILWCQTNASCTGLAVNVFQPSSQ